MNNKIQLFCFTYAGGNCSFFNEIEQEVQGIELVKFEYAGHGERHKEPFYNDFNELSIDLYNEFRKTYHSGDYALFGYSMGSISMVVVLGQILKSGMKKPKHVFLAAHEPHTKSELLGFKPNVLDEWVKKRTIEFGAVPERLIDNKVFWRTYLPIYRADYTIIGKYDFDSLNIETEIPATIFYSEKDTPYNEMKHWDKFFIGHNDYQGFEGGHFFIKEHHKEMADIIQDRLGIGL
ncbi:MAG: hypothetical protein K6G24_05690 [Lachnospiraceae bacterium]|nr:hypothetical protein [Lachnospiraceae bacterium]